MMGTAASSLCAFSSAACPPRLKMPTLYPVLPRLRVGMAACVLGFAGRGGNAAMDGDASAAPLLVKRAAATAPVALRKLRRPEVGGCFMVVWSLGIRLD